MNASRHTYKDVTSPISMSHTGSGTLRSSPNEGKTYVAAKEPYIIGKQPCMTEKEPYIIGKEPCITEKKPTEKNPYNTEALRSSPL